MCWLCVDMSVGVALQDSVFDQMGRGALRLVLPFGAFLELCLEVLAVLLNGLGNRCCLVGGLMSSVGDIVGLGVSLRKWVVLRTALWEKIEGALCLQWRMRWWVTLLFVV